MTQISRHRERILVELAVDDVVYEEFSPVPRTIESEARVAEDKDKMDDVVWDNFKKRIQNGQIINNPMSYVRNSVELSGSMDYQYDDGPNRYQVTGPTTAYNHDNDNILITGSVDAQADVARCKQKAIAEIDSTPYEFGEDSLELGETLRFLRNPLGGLLGLSRKFRKDFRKRVKKLDPKAIQAFAKAHASLWLQYRFAVSPLIRSTMDALEAYSSEPPLEPPRKTARGFSFEEDSDTSTDLAPNSWIYKVVQHKSSQGKATILYMVTNPCYDWSYRLGFRPKDFPTTIWQIMPYSFMVDRLYDVTSFSKGAINLGDPMVRILMGCYSEHNEKTSLFETVGRSPDPYGVVNSSDKPIYTDFTYNRSPWVPTFSDTVPKLKPLGLVEDATKITDLITLILGNFRFV